MKTLLRLLISILLFFLIVVILFNSRGLTYRDAGDKEFYREMIGASYTVIGPLDAYGIRDERFKDPIRYITLIPPPGIGGPEVSFKATVPIGTEIEIVRVHRTNRIFDNPISLEVHIKEDLMPTNAPIIVDLMRGNQGTQKVSLNPNIYRKNP